MAVKKDLNAYVPVSSEGRVPAGSGGRGTSCSKPSSNCYVNGRQKPPPTPHIYNLEFDDIMS